MENKLLYIALISAVFILWFIPALILTLKIRRHEGISAELKKQLILPMWVVPIVGALVCFFVFAKLGRIPPLSDSTHRDIWLSED